MQHDMHHGSADSGTFPRTTDGLPSARRTHVLRPSDGAELCLRIAPVAARIGDATVRMLAYNGSIPGPTLRVQQGSEVLAMVQNDGDVEATVHWHGLRIDNRYDGVPFETQAPIPIGGIFTYRVRFPDPGVFWYHPHIREDYTQDMGLYGNIVVEPTDAGYWPPADREVMLTVDDILMEEGTIATYDRSGASHVAMGRFGNVFLVNGSPEWSLDAEQGEVLRFLVTNTANTRVFDLAFPGATMKLVGGDNGRYERETFVDDVVLAPSERAVVDVRYELPGTYTLIHRTPRRTTGLGRITVREGTGSGVSEAFSTLRTNPEFETERAMLAADLDREPDEGLALVAEMDMGTPAEPGASTYSCPMHPEVVSEDPGRCPKCGMALVPVQLAPAPHAGHDPAEAPGHAAGSIEWDDTMPEMNRMTTGGNMRWLLVDRRTGNRNADIDWEFAVGDRVKIRLVNEMDSDHPMHHPFHIHGAGRFLVIARDGDPEPNLVWKDTVLVKTGEVVDIVLDVTNPGLWMAHCHIAEHIENGMMFSFRVTGEP